MRITICGHIHPSPTRMVYHGCSDWRYSRMISCLPPYVVAIKNVDALPLGGPGILMPKTKNNAYPYLPIKYLRQIRRQTGLKFAGQRDVTVLHGAEADVIGRERHRINTSVTEGYQVGDLRFFSMLWNVGLPGLNPVEGLALSSFDETALRSQTKYTRPKPILDAGRERKLWGQNRLNQMYLAVRKTTPMPLSTQRVLQETNMKWWLSPIRKKPSKAWVKVR